MNSSSVKIFISKCHFPLKINQDFLETWTFKSGVGNVCYEPGCLLVPESERYQRLLGPLKKKTGASLRRLPLTKDGMTSEIHRIMSVMALNMPVCKCTQLLRYSTHPHQGRKRNLSPQRLLVHHSLILQFDKEEVFNLPFLSRLYCRNGSQLPSSPRGFLSMVDTSSCSLLPPEQADLCK